MHIKYINKEVHFINQKKGIGKCPIVARSQVQTLTNLTNALGKRYNKLSSPVKHSDTS